MGTGTIELLRRVEGIVGEYQEFFKAVAKWYDDVKLARKWIRRALGRPEAGSSVSIAANGQARAGDVMIVKAHARSLSWVLPANVLISGFNEVILHLEKSPGPPLRVESVTVSQEQGCPRQTLDLSVANPLATRDMDLVLVGDAHLANKCMAVNEAGFLVFQLRLERSEPVEFCLTLPSMDDDLVADLRELLDKVLEKVQQRKEQLQALERQARKLAYAQDIETLDAYIDLHKRQIAPAILSDDTVTLEEIIARAGDVEHIVVEVEAPGEIPEVRPARPARRPRLAPPPVEVVPVRPRQRSSGRSCLSSCLIVMVILALVAGGLAYAGWVYLAPTPTVQFDSLTEGQTVPAGGPLQVWLSAEDLFGVTSMTLTVDAAGSDLVEGLPVPQRFDFAEGLGRTGSKVFTLNLKPDSGVEAQTLTLTATVVNQLGRTFTLRRTLKVGGSGKALVLAIQPAEPKPMQKVDVIVRAVNLPPGTVVTCTVAGTDGYTQRETLTLAADGTARFEVPGSFSGVVDVIDAWIEGTDVRQKAAYEF